MFGFTGFSPAAIHIHVLTLVARQRHILGRGIATRIIRTERRVWIDDPDLWFQISTCSIVPKYYRGKHMHVYGTSATIGFCIEMHFCLRTCTYTHSFLSPICAPMKSYETIYIERPMCRSYNIDYQHHRPLLAIVRDSTVNGRLDSSWAGRLHLAAIMVHETLVGGRW